jgi:copper chaperone CopZ
LQSRLRQVPESIKQAIVTTASMTSSVLKVMDPARPNDPDPASPFFPGHGDQPIIETIEIATEGEDCDECVRKLREPLTRINGVQDVRVDTKKERVIVTFDARKTHVPDLHDAILKSGYKPARFAEP